MPHLEVTATVPVAAPAERTWELLCDTSRYAEWVEDTEEVSRTDGPASPGSTYDEVNPILGPWKSRTHWTVVEFDAPRRQVHRTHDIPLVEAFDVVIELTPQGDDACELTLTLRGDTTHGPLGAGFAAAQKGKLEKNNRKTAENFALVASSSPVASS